MNLIRLTLTFIVIIGFVVQICTLFFIKQHRKKTSNEILKDQTKKNADSNYFNKNIENLNKLYNKDFNKSKYVNISGEYTQLVITYKGTETVEHYLGAHRVKLPSTRVLEIDKIYNGSGYLYNGIIYIVEINGENILEESFNVMNLKKTGVKDGSYYSSIGKTSIFVSLWILFLIFVVTTEMSFRKSISFILIWLILGTLGIIISEYLVYLKKCQPLYKLTGYFEKHTLDTGKVNGIPIKGKEISKIQNGQYIAIEGIKEKTNAYLIVKKINNKVCEKPKIKGFIILSLTLITVVFSFNLYKIYTNPEHKNYKKHKNLLESNSKEIFNGYDEINNFEFVKGQKIIFKDLYIFETQEERYLIKNIIPLSEKKEKIINDAYKNGLLVLKFINQGILATPLNSKKINMIKNYVESEGDTNFRANINALYPLTKEQSKFVSDCLNEENILLLEINNETEEELDEKIKLKTIGIEMPYIKKRFTILKGKNNFLLNQKEELIPFLKGYAMDQISGFVENIEYQDGVKIITINGFFNPFEQEQEDFKYINILFVAYFNIILLLAIVIFLRVFFYKKQKQLYERE